MLQLGLGMETSRERSLAVGTAGQGLPLPPGAGVRKPALAAVAGAFCFSASESSLERVSALLPAYKA